MWRARTRTTKESAAAQSFSRIVREATQWEPIMQDVFVHERGAVRDLRTSGRARAMLGIRACPARGDGDRRGLQHLRSMCSSRTTWSSATRSPIKCWRSAVGRRAHSAAMTSSSAPTPPSPTISSRAAKVSIRRSIPAEPWSRIGASIGANATILPGHRDRPVGAMVGAGNGRPAEVTGQLSCRSSRDGRHGTSRAVPWRPEAAAPQPLRRRRPVPRVGRRPVPALLRLATRA